MNKKKIRLQFRDAMNRLTGKQVLIDQYNALNSELCRISDNTTVGTPLKKYLLTNLDRITEFKPVDAEYGAYYIDSYNPYRGKKAITKKKIMDLLSLLHTVQQMQPQQGR